MVDEDDRLTDRGPQDPEKTVNPGGPLATPETREGQQAANEEGEEA
jgi:hypothetical protein